MLDIFIANMSRTHVLVVLAYPAPNPPSVYVIPRDVINESVWDAMHEDRGGFPNWCTGDDDDDDVSYEHFDLAAWAEAIDGDITAPYPVITHSFSYVVS